jgi:hypothetical protein
VNAKRSRPISANVTFLSERSDVEAKALDMVTLLPLDPLLCVA